jgi:REP element-mobilizing transposase RayT
MARAGRSFEEGRIYHVYNRVGGGSMEFSDEDLAATFASLLRAAMARDEATVLAWCLLGNHYHLVVRQGPVPLSRPMKTLQQGVTCTRNIRCRIFGPLWQGRFKAKEVVDERYLIQLIAYVHLNPVKAGLADEAGGYRWSGHRDVVGRRREPIVAVDDVLLLYGETRRRALRAYRSAMATVIGEEGSELVSPGDSQACGRRGLRGRCRGPGSSRRRGALSETIRQRGAWHDLEPRSWGFVAHASRMSDWWRIPRA